MFWHLDFREIGSVFRERAAIRQAKQDAMNLGFGLVAATLVNIHRKKGTRPVQPSDFFAGPEERLTVNEAVEFLDRWADRQNERVSS